MEALERDFLGRPRRTATRDLDAAPYPGESQGVTLRAVVRVLRRRWLIVALCTAAVTAGALALSLSENEQYESTATLLFRPANVGGGLFDAPSSRQADVDRAATTNLDLAELGVIAERTARSVNVPGMTGGDVASKVDLSAKRDSDLAKITAKTTDPQLSSRIANAYAAEYIAFRRQVDRASVRAARKLITRQLARLSPRQRKSPDGRRLRRVARELQVTEALRTGSAELVQRARASSDSVSPRPRRDAALGLLLGLMLGVSLAFVRERLDRHVKDETDLERAIGLPILATIPRSRSREIWGTDMGSSESSPESEAFRMLRANVHFFADREVRSLLVTSTVRGEGKSAVSWNLALAEAQAGRHVVLIETDLRGEGLAERLKLPRSIGLNLLLAGAASIEECSVSITTANGGLDVVLAGPTPRNPAPLLESHAMQALIEDACERYDVVILDAAPASIVSDTAPLMRLVDGVLVVVRKGKTRSDFAADLRRRLDKLGTPVLGVVVNSARRIR